MVVNVAYWASKCQEEPKRKSIAGMFRLMIAVEILKDKLMLGIKVFESLSSTSTYWEEAVKNLSKVV